MKVWALLLGLCVVVMLGGGAASVSAQSPTPTPSPGWSDEFASPLLRGGWSWVHEDNTHWSLTAAPGFMRIVGQAGDLPASPGAYNILLETPPSGDFEIDTVVAFSPNSNFEQAGLVVYQSDTLLLKLVRLYVNGDQDVDFALSNGTYVESFASCAYTTTYLKIVKAGSQWSGYFSGNGIDWALITTHDSGSMAGLSVGLVAFNGPGNNATINADFDSFRLYRNVSPTPSPTYPAMTTAQGDMVIAQLTDVQLTSFLSAGFLGGLFVAALFSFWKGR